MEILMPLLAAIALFILLLSIVFKQKAKPVMAVPMNDDYRQLLTEQVVFYQHLSETKKKEFEIRVQQFLASVKITGVNTEVEDLDKVLIAASAITPIFGFPDWEYVNLKEVLLYPDSFDHDFAQTGSNRNILGMVGSGAYNNVMILSQHELRQAFLNKTGKSNTAIHEFVHLVDKTDGTVDGIPSFIMDKKYMVPWLQLMQEEMKKILANRSDINPYGATNEAEFFAVVAEYFFERPELLAQKNPELYELLSSIFRQQPRSKS